MTGKIRGVRPSDPQRGGEETRFAGLLQVIGIAEATALDGTEALP
jgi:hypothetical protein